MHKYRIYCSITLCSDKHFGLGKPLCAWELGSLLIILKPITVLQASTNPLLNLRLHKMRWYSHAGNLDGPWLVPVRHDSHHLHREKSKQNQCIIARPRVQDLHIALSQGPPSQLFNVHVQRKLFSVQSCESVWAGLGMRLGLMLQC